MKDVIFNLNTLDAILPYEDSFFDFVYGISIFTHLSEKMHFEWRSELSRIIKKDGILILTMQGNMFKTILTESEIKNFEADKLVVRGNVKEGHRTYSAFHPDQFMKNLFEEFEVMEHQKSYIDNGKPQQDVWVLRKK
ncbi:class I SAM-dependent methyltransferase [Chryseobacterium sp. Leaf313]|uniref:class I SAM-dependent methyltransferase n=1 Tax=Chryseobacterium sp. Leaf313 TaxID=2876563 RepID=UPI001E469731|nr:class I SAM-dependent methyltransferase [Chryseobacterium sp. Leaf313]